MGFDGPLRSISEGFVWNSKFHRNLLSVSNEFHGGYRIVSVMFQISGALKDWCSWRIQGSLISDNLRGTSISLLSLLVY